MSMKLRAPALALLAALAAAGGPASACGLEDPSSIAFLRGTLQLAYPNALHVGTAVWQAQMAGTLPRDAYAQRDDLAPEARAKLRLVKANALLAKLAARLNAGPAGAKHPGIAIVLVGPVLWTRFEPGEGPVRAQVHVPGPEQGDVVVVTDIPVLEAIATGTLDVANAVEQGLMRLYGVPDEVSVAHGWLSAGTRG
jgi:glutathione S-transferase